MQNRIFTIAAFRNIDKLYSIPILRTAGATLSNFPAKNPCLKING